MLFCQIASVVSDSVRPHGLQPTRLLHPWDSPGKNSGVGCHFLLQYMKVKSESEATQSCLTLSNPMDCSLPGSSVHGIFQARVLEWGAIAFSAHTAHQSLKWSHPSNTAHTTWPSSSRIHGALSLGGPAASPTLGHLINSNSPRLGSDPSNAIPQLQAHGPALPLRPSHLHCPIQLPYF